MTKSIYIHALLQTQSIYFQFIFDQKSNTLDNFTKLFSLHEKHIYMFICYRFQTCCNIKIYIYCNFGGSYYIFLFEDYLFNSFRQHLFHGKRKGVYFSYLFFDYNALYMYMFPFFQQCKKTARSAISNFTQSYVIWSSHFQEFL